MCQIYISWKLLIWLVLVESIFSSASAFSFIDHNGKNWMIERKWNQKLLSPRTVLVCIYGDATAENSVFGFASA